MIENKNDLIETLKQDARANGRDSIQPRLFHDDIWKLIVLLRLCRYFDYKRRHNRLTCILFYIVHYLYRKRSLKLGISIPYKTEIGPGLAIPHYGTIVVSDKTVIGKYCRIHTCVNIGSNAGSESPKIGDYVYIGPGTKIVGDIVIADNVVLGAGTVVIKSILHQGTTWAGVPARKISDNSSHNHLSRKIFSMEK